MASIRRTNSLFGVMILGMAPCCLFLAMSFILLDDCQGSVGVSRPHEDADFEAVRQPGLAVSVQLARDALALKGRFNIFRFVGIIDRVDGHGVVNFHNDFFLSGKGS